MKINILALAAHPDDAELCVAGTLLKHMSMGYTAGVIDLTQGELGTRGTPELRLQEAAESARLMGLSARENLGMRDGFIEMTEENLHKLIRVIRKYQPDVVLANAVQDRHPDHVMASQLQRRACFLAGLRRIETTDENGALQSPWRPKSIYHYIQNDHVVPDVCVDITGFLDGKMEAIKCFKSQFYDPNSDEPETAISTRSFFDYIISIARAHGRPLGYEFAEGYTVNREVGAPNLLELD